jgi:hypothetical protein
MYNKLLHAVLAHRVAELSAPELRSTEAFLLLLDPSATFQCDSQCPLQDLVGNRDVWLRRYQFDKSANRFLDARRVTPTQRPQVNATLEKVLPALAPQLVPALGQEVTYQAK